MITQHRKDTDKNLTKLNILQSAVQVIQDLEAKVKGKLDETRGLPCKPASSTHISSQLTLASFFYIYNGIDFYIIHGLILCLLRLSK